MEPVEFQPIQTDTKSSEHKPELPTPLKGNEKEFHLPEKTIHTSDEEKKLREGIIRSMLQMSVQQLQHNANAARARQRAARGNQ